MPTVPVAHAAAPGLQVYESVHGIAAAIGRARESAAAAGASTAALYLDAASGSLRHALLHWSARRTPPGEEEFERGYGRSTLRSVGGRPVEARSCRHAVEERVDAVCVHADADIARCVWTRRIGDDGGLARRGRIQLRRGELWFEDDQDADVGRVGAPTPSLAADLVSSGAMFELCVGSAAAALLAQALADGSWLHLGTRARWFVDAGSARAFVAAVAGRLPTIPSDKLAGAIDVALLARIEALGWRHVPTPAIGRC